MHQVNGPGSACQADGSESQQSNVKPTYKCCEWYGCALACVPIPTCGEQSYAHTGF